MPSYAVCLEMDTIPEPATNYALIEQVPAASRLLSESTSHSRTKPELRNQWEPADPNPVRLNDDNAAISEVVLDRREVGQQYLRLMLGSSLRAVTKQHDRGRALSAQREQRSEIRVRRHNHALLLLGASEDLSVAGCLHSVVTNVPGVVSHGPKSFGDYRRECIVDQKPHAEAASGSSRSRTASAA